jgi:hypothetical protein
MLLVRLDLFQGETGTTKAQVLALASLVTASE